MASCWPSLPRAAQVNSQPADTRSLSPCNAQPQPTGLGVSGKLMEALILSNLQGQTPEKWESHFWTSPLPAHFHTGFKITNYLNQNSWKPFSPFPSSGLRVSPMADSGLLQWYLTPLTSAAPSTLVSVLVTTLTAAGEALNPAPRYGAGGKLLSLPLRGLPGPNPACFTCTAIQGIQWNYLCK